MVPSYNDLISFYVKWGNNAYPAECLVGLKKPLDLNVLLTWCLVIVMSKEGPPAPVQPLSACRSLAPYPSLTHL